MSRAVNPAQAIDPIILALDIGTSSTRAVLFDGQARPVADMRSQIPNKLQTTPDGGAQFDPQALLQIVTQVIDDLLSRDNTLTTRISAVVIDTFVTNIVGVDPTGQPLTPLLTYADTRSAPDAARLRARFDLSTVQQRTGCRIHSTYLPAQFSWLARTQPALFDAVAHWLSLGEYLFWEFFGGRQVTYSVASWSGLLNRHRLNWDETWLRALSLPPEKLSPLVDVDQPAQGLGQPWATRWPALRDIPWFPAIGDGAAANLGSGCTGPERLALTMGTTGAMRVALKQPVDTVPAGLWLYRIDRQYSLLGGATTEGGNLFAWLNRVLQLPANTEALLAQMEPAGHGLTVLPFLAGERAPGWHESARASISGLTLNSRPIDILQAGLEAVAYRFALIHRKIAPHLPPEHQIIASGSGLLNSPAWMQIMADVLGRPITASAEKEATARGSVVLALQALGSSPPEPAKVGRRYDPLAAHHTRHQERLQVHESLYKKLIETPGT